MPKLQTIQLMDEAGLNVPELIVKMGQFQDNKAVVWESLLAKLKAENKNQRISIRTERDAEVLCPHHPNVSLRDGDKIVHDLHKKGYAVIIFRGIDPSNCRIKGNILRRDTGSDIEYYSEFTLGPGTVRSNEKSIVEHCSWSVAANKKVKLINASLKDGSRETQFGLRVLKDLVELCMRHQDLMKTDIIEWSYYDPPTGKLKEHFIFWEMRPWR